MVKGFKKIFHFVCVSFSSIPFTMHVLHSLRISQKKTGFVRLFGIINVLRSLILSFFFCFSFICYMRRLLLRDYIYFSSYTGWWWSDEDEGWSLVLEHDRDQRKLCILCNFLPSHMLNMKWSHFSDWKCVLLRLQVIEFVKSSM